MTRRFAADLQIRCGRAGLSLKWPAHSANDALCEPVTPQGS